MIVERAAAGGQAGQSSRIENYLGFPDGVAGDQLTERARRQALRFGAELLTARTVIGLEAEGPARQVTFDDGTFGARPTRWCWPPASAIASSRPSGADHLVGRGVYYGSAATQAQACAGEHVIIVGGANSAGSGGGVLRPACGQGDDGRPRRLAGHVDVELPDRPDRGHRQHRGPAEHLGAASATDKTICSASPWSTHDGGQEVVDAGHLFVFIGAAPLTDWLPRAVVARRRPAS